MLKCFQQLFGFFYQVTKQSPHYDYDQKCPSHTLVLKTDVTLVQMLRLIILEFFTWKSFSVDRRLYLDVIKWQWKPDMVDLTHSKQLLKFCIVYIQYTLYYLSGEKLRRWSVCGHAQASAQSDLRLCCSHMTKQIFSFCSVCWSRLFGHRLRLCRS